MDSNAFDLLIDRLERIEKQNDTQMSMLRDHHAYVDAARQTVLAQVDQIRLTVNGHQTYFSLLGWLGLPTFTAAIGYLFTKFGWK
jgi:hypothetical protein